MYVSSLAVTSVITCLSSSSSIGHLLVNVTAEDNDIFDTISYSIVSGVPDSNSFEINGNGTISVAGPIDRELVDVYMLRVAASDTASPPHITTTTVTITILDRNEHPPVFSKAFYTPAILENQPIGLTVTSDISVTDADAESKSAVFHLEDVMVGERNTMFSRLRESLLLCTFELIFHSKQWTP